MNFDTQVNCWNPANSRDFGFQLPMLINVSKVKESIHVYHKFEPDNSVSVVSMASPGYVSAPPRPQMRNSPGPSYLLSKREKEVLKLAAAGLSNKEIAQKCFLSESTVKTHFHNIFSKIDVSNRTAAVMHATAEGLLY